MKRIVSIVLLLTGASLFANAADQENPPHSSMCTEKKACYDLNNQCVCYCSHLCGPRLKKPDDTPVYVENDPEGHYCYCKQWDLDNYWKNKCNVNNPYRK